MKNIHLQQLDLTNQAAVSIFLEKNKFDAVLHLAANSNPNDCQRDH